MSDNSTAPTTVKKAAKKEGGSETVRRTRVTPLRGWTEVQAKAYGSVPGSMSLALNPISPLAVKKKTATDGGELVQVTKPINVLVTGKARIEDDKVFIIVDPEYVEAHREAENAFLSAGNELINHDGKAQLQTYFSDNMVKLKAKHFNGRYVSKFEAGTRSEELEASDAFGTDKLQLVLRYYGLYTTEDCYGPLVSVAAFNLLSNQ